MDPLAVAADRSAFAAILDAQGRHREAMAPLSEALTMVQGELGRHHYEVASLLITFAGVAWRAGEAAQAEASYRRALAIQRRILGSDHVEVRTTQRHLDTLRRPW